MTCLECGGTGVLIIDRAWDANLPLEVFGEDSDTRTENYEARCHCLTNPELARWSE
jgi:hypothetical protein